MTDLPAGPELDRAVAEKVMGWQLSSIEQPPGLYNLIYVYRDKWDGLRKGWSPSTNIAHAWETLEALAWANSKGEQVWYWSVGQTALGYECIGVLRDEDCDPIRRVKADAETAPLAICRAALDAIDA